MMSSHCSHILPRTEHTFSFLNLFLQYKKIALSFALVLFACDWIPAMGAPAAIFYSLRGGIRHRDNAAWQNPPAESAANLTKSRIRHGDNAK
jgi:hypothetical protein